MNNPARRWYAVQTHPGRESLAEQQLRNQNFTVFFPLQMSGLRRARRLEQRAVSYFPGYIFVRLNLQSDRWRSINGTFGVRSLVMFGDRPAPLPDGFVEFLRSMTDDNGLFAPTTIFNEGDRVRILSGPFADLVGTIDRLESGARARILMGLIGGSVSIVTPSQNLALASN